MPLPAAIGARAHSDVGCMVAQNSWSLSTPCALHKSLTHYLPSYTTYASNATWGLEAACLGCA
eukprot:6173351-Pleurochrysis_carterae.AAC.1